MKTIIAGSRGITDYRIVQCAMARASWETTEVVSGGARGVDRLGERWAREHGIPIKQFIPDWDGLGKSAGFRRNEAMVMYADALVAVWDGESSGTRHTIQYARRLGLSVLVVHPDDEQCREENA